MRNRKLFKSAVLITAVMLSVSGCAGGCSNQAEPVSAEPTETVSEVETEESLESTEPAPSPTSSPTATPTEEPVEESSESETDTSAEEESEPDLGYEIIPIDDTVMYATTDCNLRNGPSTDYDIVGSLSYAQEITVNGKVEQDGNKLWWVLKTEDGTIQMVSGGLVSTTKPVQQPSSSGNNGGSSQQPSGGGSTQQPSGGGSTDGGSSSGGDGGFDAGFFPGATEVGQGGLEDSGHQWTVE